MTVLEFDDSHVEPFLRFVTELPDGDVTFIKEPVADADDIRSWLDRSTTSRHWVVVQGDELIAFLAVLTLPGWSDHVGEVRLVVHPEHRGRGWGRTLARRALVHAAKAGLSKLIVEIIAEDAAHIGMFTAIGFTGEALLLDHIRDREGGLRDLVVLAHYLEGTATDLDLLGLTGELAGQ
jgi:ribosomal protein S18 acetylase RimI-like enzyme